MDPENTKDTQDTIADSQNINEPESKEQLLEKANSEINKLQEKLSRSDRELSVLFNVSNAMRTSLELNTILHTILTGVTAHSGLGFNRAVLFLENNSERCLEPRMAIGPESGEHAEKIWQTENKLPFFYLRSGCLYYHNIVCISVCIIRYHLQVCE